MSTIPTGLIEQSRTAVEAVRLAPGKGLAYLSLGELKGPDWPMKIGRGRTTGMVTSRTDQESSKGARRKA